MSTSAQKPRHEIVPFPYNSPRLDVPYRPDLIIDIGLHHGLDSEFYLMKGFRTVGVEANPSMAKMARERLQPYIDSGDFQLEACGLGPDSGTFTFYENLDNDEWSSFREQSGTRGGSNYRTIEVQCITPQSLFQKHGMPYYLKIDIEGYDLHVVRALTHFTSRPRYISAEDGGIHTLLELYRSGCQWFNFLDQKEKWKIQPANPPREGRFVERVHGPLSSGPFGAELPGRWMPIYEAVYYYMDHIRGSNWALKSQTWYDIHGCYEDAAPNDPSRDIKVGNA